MRVEKMQVHLIILALTLSAAAATEVQRCSDDKPFPLAVRVQDCEIPPCDIIKGSDISFEIDFVVFKYITKLTTIVRATAMGITTPYVLPEDVRDVCANLMYGAYCPLYPTEDATYLFVFPIGNYPEIGVKVEISLQDQDGDTATCFVCSIKVKKGNPSSHNNTIYEIDF